MNASSNESRRFAQELLGRPLPDPSAPLRAALVEQEHRAWLEAISPAREQWDPSKHPRGGFPQNRGWFSQTSGSSDSSGGVQIAQASQKQPNTGPGSPSATRTSQGNLPPAFAWQDMKDGKPVDGATRFVDRIEGSESHPRGRVTMDPKKAEFEVAVDTQNGVHLVPRTIALNMQMEVVTQVGGIKLEPDMVQHLLNHEKMHATGYIRVQKQMENLVRELDRDLQTVPPDARKQHAETVATILSRDGKALYQDLLQNEDIRQSHHLDQLDEKRVVIDSTRGLRFTRETYRDQLEARGGQRFVAGLDKRTEELSGKWREFRDAIRTRALGLK